MKIETKAWNPEYAGLKGSIISLNRKGDTNVLLENGMVIEYKHNLPCHGLERYHTDLYGRKVSERYEPTDLGAENLHKFEPEIVETQLNSGGKVVLDRRNATNPIMYLIDKNGEIVI